MPMFTGRASAKSDHQRPGPFILQSCDYEHFMDWGLAAGIAQLFIAREGTARVDILELGAGCGCYTDFFSWLGFRMHAFDGSRNIANLTNGLVSTADLSLPQTFPMAEWVVSLEVGEHIPKEQQSVFLHNLVDHAKRGVVLSWALPHQTDGPAHPNQLKNGEVIAEMEKLGMRHDAKGSLQLRENAGHFCCSWFKRTIMVFVKRAR